ncbi:hypothetical protein PPTG_17680 [Phytophthora nicotianae INRA-310]|uniref:Mid2 domain-containing protein n=3 Tax=Phytophthora nicotianae TaxID=4792 RepID=W2PKS2_PHYN3|nr:hypothetical protein PPTG_17680 [Phytophthora nicotianae INRA-310]ETN00824.1 hypothetical protein PPTG_17680 [Phytophthora nicotianae INRA-310]
MVLVMISSTGIQAQDAGTVTAANPEVTAPAVDTATPVDTTAPPVTGPAAPIVTTAAPVVTEAVTTPPVATEAVTVPAVTEASTTSTPVSTPAPVATDAATETPAPVSTDPPTTSTPTATPSTVSESSVPILHDTTSPQNLRGNDDGSSASASSLSSSSRSVLEEHKTGTLNGMSSTKMMVICVLGGVGLTVILSLLFVLWRHQRRDDLELGTPIAPDTTAITSPPASAASANAAAWKAKESSYPPQMPLAANTRAKMNATTRSSAEFDMANRISQIANPPAHSTKPNQANRETNASSERSFSIRGYSEFSLHHEGDSEASVITNDRYSTNDGYSTSDRYSMSSRLSSEVGRSNSGWFQRQAPNSLDRHRFSSTSSTASSIAARKHTKVSFVNPDLTQTSNTETAAATTSRTDVPDWYRVIESPSDNDRYTTASLDSDNISSERESFEL